MSDKKNYIVTGAAGFIGSRVAELLLDQGHSVIGIDNLNEAYDVRLKNWRLSRLTEQTAFTFHEADISDKAGLVALFSRKPRIEISAVFNLAARAGVRQSAENPYIYYEANVVGTLNLLNLCNSLGIRKFVLASTSSLYGAPDSAGANGQIQPFREDDRTDRPLSPYAASKKAAEALCYSFYHLYGLDITIFRYFTVYGPAGRPDMSLFRFVQWISEEKPVIVYGDGHQTRDFTYVEDVARGTVAGLKPAGYEIINLGSDRPVELLHAIGLIEQALNKKAELKFEERHAADVTATWANISKAKNLLGWQPEVNIEKGVCRLVEWYKENRTWAKYVVTN